MYGRKNYKQWNGRWVKKSNTGAVRQPRKSGGRSRRRGATRRSAGKKFTRLLSDKKINTLVEVRMKEIAQDQIKKDRKLLTSRKYLFVKYDKHKNTFDPFPMRPDLIDFTGRCVELSNIPKTDSETVVNLPQLDDPLTMGNEQLDDNDGANQVAIYDPINGYRFTDQIYLQSVSAQLRIRSEQLEDTDLDIYGQMKIYYAFVLWKDEETAMDIETFKPEPIQLMSKPKSWGFSAKLDTSLNATYTGLQTRILCSGECVLNLNDIETSEKYHTIFKKFDKPILLNFKSDSQTGQKVDKKIYFVARSTVPEHIDFKKIKPSMYVCTKLNYFEA